MLTWHALAKMRIHSDITVKLLQSETIELGNQLRIFKDNVCPKYTTFELPKETASRARASAARQQGTTATTESTSAKKQRTFNLQTSKIHALGDYANEVIQYGPTDGYSTYLVSYAQISSRCTSDHHL